MDDVSVAARRELLQKGFRFYRPAALQGHFDCDHLRSVEDELGAFVEVIHALQDHLDRQIWTPQLSDAWDLSEQWLRLASGLSYVDVELSTFDAPYMCGGAMDYDEAANRSASLFITEYTRLLYTWNATEVLVRAMGLPELPGHRGVVPAACQRISHDWSADPPDHQEFLLEHLIECLKSDPWLRQDKKVISSLKPEPWRTRTAVLFAVSAQLRHVLVHGALRMPIPDAWGEDWGVDNEPIGLSRLHVPRIGTRGLLLGLQMLIASRLPADLHLPVEELPTWVSELSDGRDLSVRKLVLTLHLVPAPG